MTLVLLFIIVAAAGLAGYWHYRRTSVVSFCVALIVLVAVGCGPLPAWLLATLQADYAAPPTLTWGSRNAIVLLGAGTMKIPDAQAAEPEIFSYARLVTAARLYHDCRRTGASCQVIVSGGDPQKHGEPEALVYARVLSDLGVNLPDLVTEVNSLNTWQNAKFTAEMLRKKRVDRTVLVSSGIHLRRSQLYFAHFGVLVSALRADYLMPMFGIVPAAYNFTVCDFAIHEYIGLARYSIYNALGWNSTRR